MVDMKEVREEIFGLIEKFGGKIKTKQLLSEAKKKNSKLHKYFEWDDSVAGEQFRLVQARKLLRDVTEVVIVEGKRRVIRSFFNVVDSKDEQVYTTLDIVKSNPQYKSQLFGQAERYIQHFLDVMKILKAEIMKGVD